MGRFFAIRNLCGREISNEDGNYVVSQRLTSAAVAMFLKLKVYFYHYLPASL
jgi:hypothetical protein